MLAALANSVSEKMIMTADLTVNIFHVHTNSLKCINTENT